MALLRKQAQGGFGGNGGGKKKLVKENVVVVMTEDPHRADPKKATPSEDYFKGVLQHDAFGLSKGDEVQVKVDVKSPKRKQNAEKVAASGDRSKSLMEIVDLTFGERKGAGAMMEQNPTIVLEKAFLDNQTGFVVAEFLHVGTHSDTIENERVESGKLVSVDKVRKSTGEDGETKARQRRYLYDRDAAELVSWSDPATSVDAIQKAVVDVLAKASESEYKRPFAVLQIVNSNPQPELPFGYEAVSAHIPLVYDAENKTNKSPEESFRAFFTEVKLGEDGKPVPLKIEQKDANGNSKWVVAKDEQGNVVPRLRNQDVVDVLESAFQEFESGVLDYVVQVIPGYSFSTGRDSLPGGNSQGDAMSFLAPGEDDYDGSKLPFDVRYLSEGSMVLGRVKKRELGEWYAKKTFPTYSWEVKLFSETEIVTKHTPEAIKAVFEENAERRFQEKVERLSKKDSDKERSASREQSQSQDDGYRPGEDDINEEQEDLSSGMSMGR